MTETPEAEPPDAEGAETFAELGIHEDVLEAIDEMGWETPTPVQRDFYPLAIAGHDVIVQSRTGTGKTGAFGIPLVDRLLSDDGDEQALVLAPTRELALQSAREIAKLGVRRGIDTVAVYGGASMEQQIRALEKGARVISGTPGRVLDHLKRGTIEASRLRVLVLDEADEMLSMGFAKELHAIIERLPKKRQTLLFSATVDRAIKRVAEKHMHEPQFLGLSGDHVGALGIEHFVGFVEHQDAQPRCLDRSALEVVEDTPRRSADDAGPFFECANLLLHRSAAVDGDGVDVAARSELCDLTCALQSQLARRREYERLCVAVVRKQSIDERNPERTGFPRSRSRLNDDVVSGDGQRVGVALHRRRGFPTHFIDRC